VRQRVLVIRGGWLPSWGTLDSRVILSGDFLLQRRYRRAMTAADAWIFYPSCLWRAWPYKFESRGGCLAALANRWRTIGLHRNFFDSLLKKRCVKILDGYTIQQKPGRWATAFLGPPLRELLGDGALSDDGAPGVGSSSTVKA
jgi:hypothetical protein